MNAPTLPNFILAGAGESGTTSLYRYLKQHPQVYMCPVKEPNYFAADDILSLPDFKPLAERQFTSLLTELERQDCSRTNFSITKWEHYLRLFQDARDQVAIGEASVMYLWFPSAARAIHRTLPRVKLIFILRDPAQRLFTLYSRKPGTDLRLTFRDWVMQSMQAEPARRQGKQRHPVPLDCGLYATHLQQFFNLFPREQIRIYLYETYHANAGAVLRDIFGFLGVNANHPLDMSHRYNETMVPRFPVLHRLRRRLVGDAPLSPWMPTPVHQALSSFYHRPKGRLALDSADRRLVINYYRDEILRTQDLIGRDLSAWLR